VGRHFLLLPAAAAAVSACFLSPKAISGVSAPSAPLEVVVAACDKIVAELTVVGGGVVVLDDFASAWMVPVDVAAAVESVAVSTLFGGSVLGADDGESDAAIAGSADVDVGADESETALKVGMLDGVVPAEEAGVHEGAVYDVDEQRS
jgi:hypothetical protein